MKIKLIFLAVSLILSGQSAWSQDCAVKPEGWTIHVNPSKKKNETKSFKIWIGGSRDNSFFWMTWKEGMPLNFPVPIKLSLAKEIWMQVQTGEDGRNFNLWTFFNGHSTKNWESDGEINDETSQTDHGN